MAAAAAFMVVATLCGSKLGVDTCLVQADTHLFKTRSECIARGKELIKGATTAFGYARVATPYRTKIFCAPKGTSVTRAQQLKPAETGTADVPQVVIKVDKKPGEQQTWTEYFKSWWPI